MHHCDLEANSLLHGIERIWILVSYDDDGNFWRVSYDYKEAQDKPVVDWTPRGAQIMENHTAHLNYLRHQTVNFHNYFGFDKLAIRHFIPDWMPAGEQDTLVLSQLFNPDRGKHGLDDWGERLGIPKPKYDDWSGGLTAEMVFRCFEDVRITHGVWNRLLQEAKGWSWSKPVQLEYQIADIIGRQAQHGCAFDVQRGYELADYLWNEVHKLGDKIQAKMPYVVKRGIEYKKQPLCSVSFVEPNINSDQQVKAYLLTQGWKPTTYTEKGSPQLTDDSYASINGELGETISKRSMLKHRATLLFGNGGKGLLNNVRPDGRVEAGAATNGTNTGRFRHYGVVNIPKPKDKDLPIQIRELFCAGNGKLLMGIDADGLEARMMCHNILPYDGGEEYAAIVLDGDIHAFNAKIFGTTRDGAKSPYYAIMYGCKPAKFAETLGRPLEEAEPIYNRFWQESVALNLFKEDITAQWRHNKGFIRGIDGRKIIIRSSHSIVNAAFQSTGSIVVKYATALMDKWCRENGLQAQQVLHFHDEFTYELPPEERDVVAGLASKAFEQAGIDLGIRVPVTGTPAFGRNWREIH